MVDYNSAYTGAEIDAGIAAAVTAVQPAALGTLASQNANALTLTGSVTEAIFALTDAATVDVDPANGTIQTLALTAAGRTLTFTNMVAGEAVTLMINAGASGTITTWNVTFVTAAGAVPTLATAGYTVVALWKVSTVVYAAVVGG